MKVITKEGQCFTGQAREIITALRVTSWVSSAYTDNAQYKREVAKRAKMWDGREVCTTDDKQFLLDLEKSGLLLSVEG